MIHDEDLKSSVDYSEGQKKAAHRVLVELVNLFESPPQQVKVEAERVEGAIDTAVVNVVAVVPYIIMKTAAMGRGKAKDLMTIFCVFW